MTRRPLRGRGSALNSLRTRLLAAIALIVVLSVGLTLGVASLLTHREVERSSLRQVSQRTALLAQRERDALLACSRLSNVESFLESQGERVLCLPQGQPTTYLTDEERADLRSGRPVRGTIEVGGDSYYYAAEPVRGKAFVLLRPTDLDAASSEPYLQGLLIAGLAGALLSAIAAFLLARAIEGPVRHVAEASRSLAEERSPDPVPVEGPNELASLAESFNDMAAKLAKARATERSFLLSVSHELKTPLTAIRGYAEGLEEGVVTVEEAAETIRLEAARLERLVLDLLDLARMNKSEFSVRSEPVDLALVAREAVRRYEGQARSFGVELEVEANGVAPALGDSDRVLQVVSNLVENALRVTPEGGVVRVQAEPGELVVEDNGPGLEPDELPHAFDRFYLYSRYGRERLVGTGLGLAIVKELTEGMGGTVSVTSEPHRATRFTVRLPHASAEVLRPSDVEPIRA
jgi:signal transduction histidine kinase